MILSALTQIWTRFDRTWQSVRQQDTASIAWSRFWMRFAHIGYGGRIATQIATWFVPPYKGRNRLARYHPKGYIAPNASIYHSQLQLGANIFIGDRVTIFEDRNSGSIELAERVRLYNDICIQTGEGGSVSIGAGTCIQPRCQLSAYKAPIQIGRGVQIAPNCGFYPYAHGIAPGESIAKQPLQTKGGITVDDDAWLGCGAIVLDGVRIGKGAVVGAGSVVTHDIPDGAIAVGVPARVVKLRSSLVDGSEVVPAGAQCTQAPSVEFLNGN